MREKWGKWFRQPEEQIPNFPTEWITWFRSAPKDLPKIYYLTTLLDLTFVTELWEILQLLRYRKKLIRKLNSAKNSDEWVEMAEQIMWSLRDEEYLEAHR